MLQTETNAIERKQIANYVFTIEERTNLQKYPGHPFRVIYEQLTPKGKYSKSKILNSYVFRSIKDCQQWIEKTYNNLAANLTRREEEKKKRREENAAVNAADFYKVGDIIVNTWGWEQTNVDFYQVVKVGNRTIEIHAIAGKMVDGSGQSYAMSCDMLPLKDQFLTEGKAYNLRVKAHGYLSNPASYYYMHKWDGRPMYCSWYA